MRYQITQLILLTTVLGLLSIFLSSNASNVCITEGGRCKDDYDCCGHNDAPIGFSVRCETRLQSLGRRCHSCTYNGNSCSRNSDCCSQNCIINTCAGQFKFNYASNRKPCFDSVIKSLHYIEAVKGDVLDEEGICPCTGLKQNEISHNIVAAIDKDTSTEYISNYPIGSGLILATGSHAPVRGLQICSNLDCKECDPTSYVIEGMVEDGKEYTYIQSGNLNLSEERRSCTKVFIVGRHQYSKYKVTFPSIRGGFGKCISENKIRSMSSQNCNKSNYLFRKGEIWFADSAYNPIEDVTYFSYEYYVPFDHFTINFVGDCDFKEYKLKRRTSKGHGVTVKKGLPDIYTDSLDTDLCVNGAAFNNFDENGKVIPDGRAWHYFTIQIKGKILNQEGSYGIFSSGRARYGDIKVPKCPFKACKHYPMKISEVDLLGKCNEAVWSQCILLFYWH